MSLETLITRDWNEKVTQVGMPVLVCFSADWCSACKTLIPRLEATSRAIKERAILYLVNTDKERTLVDYYAIRGLPTCIVFIQGQEATRLVGVRQESDYLQALRDDENFDFTEIESGCVEEGAYYPPDSNATYNEQIHEQVFVESASVRLLAGMCANTAVHPSYVSEAIELAKELWRQLENREVSEVDTNSNRLSVK